MTSLLAEAVYWAKSGEGAGINKVFFPVAALQRRCSPALPLPWESTDCGGEWFVFILYTK